MFECLYELFGLLADKRDGAGGAGDVQGKSGDATQPGEQQRLLALSNRSGVEQQPGDRHDVSGEQVRHAEDANTPNVPFASYTSAPQHDQVRRLTVLHRTRPLTITYLREMGTKT